MAEFKVIGKDNGKHVIEHLDGRTEQLHDDELEALKESKKKSPKSNAAPDAEIK